MKHVEVKLPEGFSWGHYFIKGDELITNLGYDAKKYPYNANVVLWDEPQHGQKETFKKRNDLLNRVMDILSGYSPGSCIPQFIPETGLSLFGPKTTG